VGDAEDRKSLLDEGDHLVEPIRDLNLFRFGAAYQSKPDCTEYNAPTHVTSATGTTRDRGAIKVAWMFRIGKQP
jgi:hypothetical protein